MYMAKRRTQLYLEEAQIKVLEARSRKTGKSMGQLVREAVDETYRKKEPRERPIPADDPLWDLVGMAAGKGKETDVSIRHDYYLYDFRKYSEKRWSYTDCVSFAYMDEIGLEDAFTFDRNFAQYGKRVHPA